VSGASAASLEAAARAKQAVRERVWALLERERWPVSPAPPGGSPTSPVLRRPPPGWPPWRRGGRPGWSRAIPTPPSSRSGLGPWPRASCCTWSSPAWPPNVPSSSSTRHGSRSRPPGAASIAGSARAGRRIGVAELRPVDLVVCGSVAVNRDGARVGKGGGFSDLEFALLVEAGLIGPGTVVATTVHPLQVLEEPLPETDHDFRLDLIVAGEEVIACRRARRPRGILWEHLDPAKVAAISALSAQAPGRATSTP
jgi:5-formyltetrahydrofolate cyclo-ligase